MPPPGSATASRFGGPVSCAPVRAPTAFLPPRGRSAPQLRASRRPHIFLRFLLQWKPKPTITAYSNLAQRGEKGVRGEGKPSPPPKHPEAVNYGGYAASLLQRSGPKGAGASCPQVQQGVDQARRRFWSLVLGHARPLTYLRPPCWERERERKGPG